MNSLINRRAGKAADSMWHRKGMFTSDSVPETNREDDDRGEKTNGYCIDFIPEKGNAYPLCDNPACVHSLRCNRSAHMVEQNDERQ